jgi:hypothetical protein
MSGLKAPGPSAICHVSASGWSNVATPNEGADISSTFGLAGDGILRAGRKLNQILSIISHTRDDFCPLLGCEFDVSRELV